MSESSAIRGAADAFLASAFTGDWEPALQGLADVCGGRAAELIGIGPEAGAEFHASVGLDPRQVADFAGAAGWDPSRNPRVKAGLRARELQVLSESDYATPEEIRRTEIYRDQFARLDIPHILQTNLLRGRDNLVGLSVLRSARQGPPGAAQRRAFAAIARAAQSAARLQIGLEGRAAALLTGAFETLQMAAFVCDRRGAVQTMSPRAEHMLAEGSHLRLTYGRLGAASLGDGPALARALALVGRGETPGSLELAVRGVASGLPLLLQVARLPEDQFPFRHEAQVLVLAKPPRDLARRQLLLQSVYQLTPAEAEVAIALGRGDTVEAIAADRDAAVGTVRVQMKRIFSKLGVRRQAEVAARLSVL